jgi:hypothetical protein
VTGLKKFIIGSTGVSREHGKTYLGFIKCGEFQVWVTSQVEIMRQFSSILKIVVPY